ncbi:hypothetical protein KKC65_01165, partial [Patescibacteria group bacterium]|nr:hypothetical protein [Patescibacteria group bacterium]
MDAETKSLLVAFLEKEEKERGVNLDIERLKEQLPQISDPEKLISLWRKAPSNLKAPIEARLSEVL